MQPVFVGDVQGCAAELEELLARAEGCFGSAFELWVVGDLVNRGPDSLRALERVRDLVERGRARYVLGNHELALLRVALGQRAVAPTDRLDELLESPDLDDWVEWLRKRPLLECGRIAGVEFAMVHAALHPDWDLGTARKLARRVEARLSDPDLARAAAFLAADRRDDRDRDTLARLLSCRSVGADDSWSPEEPSASLRAWHEAWSERSHTHGVVYGHWSLQGLYVAPRLRGLDTGCVHHSRGRDGFLTAWVPDERGDPFGVPDERFWQVRAHRGYYRMT